MGSRKPLEAKRLLHLSGEAAVWLSIAALAWIFSYGFAGKDMLFRWGAEVWPRTIAVALAVGAVAQFVMEWRTARAAPREAAEDTQRRDASHTTKTKLKVLATFLVPLVYLYLLPRTGYYLTTPFFIASIMFLFGVRRRLHLIGTNLGIFAVLLLVFSKILFVPLPTGTWPVFYDFSNWFLSIIE